jgi:hypothetical protein
MGDYDDDGYLDMYVSEWRSFTTVSSPAQARLFHNLGAADPGRFEDVTAAAGVAMDILVGPNKNKGLSFTPRFADLDRDGMTDLAVVADAGTSRMFWNDGGGKFLNRTAAAGIATGTNDMGFTLADFDGDGLLDWFVTSIGTGSGAHPSGNRLFLNNGNRTFTDVTDAAGVREGGWGWGAEAFDFDNDGDLDIAHTNGMTFIPNDQSMFFVNVGDRLTPQFSNMGGALGVLDSGQGRGLLTLDYDRDGDLDMFVVNNASSPILYRNEAVGGNWLQVETVGSSSNRNGVGAYITVTPDLTNPELFYVREITASSTYLSQSEMIAHFGLGEVDAVDQIEVEWPSGFSQRFTNVATNQLVTITEGLAADFDANDHVDGDDFVAWIGNFATAGGMTPAQGDADRDGGVDGNDFMVWQREFGMAVVSGLSASEMLRPIPEPPPFAMGVAGLVFASLFVRGGASRTTGSSSRMH